ncbi:MAG: signal peptidase II [Rhodospirillaceae bacterium]|nr:signal peptidase II [Rhodospirillaceae bacterium]
MRLGLLMAAAVILLDQVSKYVLLEMVMRPEGVMETPFLTDKIVELLPFFNLRMAWNTGISFSMFDGGGAMTYILLAVQMGITAGLIWWLRTLTGSLIQCATGLIIGGAISNIIDRIRWGAVADFFDFHVAGWHFATFNVADSCISIGVALWLLDAVLNRHHHKGEVKEPTGHD